MAGLLGAAANAQTSPPITTFPTVTASASPYGITTGPDQALWFTELGSDSANVFHIGRITVGGSVSEFPLPSTIVAGTQTPIGAGNGIATGPDGALWFTVQYLADIGRIATDGTVTIYPIPSGSVAQYIAAGPDGNMWFTEQQSSGPSYVGKISLSGQVTEFPLVSNPYALPGQITTGPDGALWFTVGGFDLDTGLAISLIGRSTTSGVVTTYPLPMGADPVGIASGPDGALWFTDVGAVAQIGRITTSGQVTEFPTTTPSSGPLSIVVGPDQALWFTENSVGNIGRITTAGVITEYPLPNQPQAPQSIILGPDQALWFTEPNASDIGRLLPPFSLNCNLPASVEVGEAFTASCSAASGAAPYTFSVSAGELPPGLGLDPVSGTIKGVPTTAGTFSFTIQVKDSASPSNTALFPVSNFMVAARLPTAISCNFSGTAQDAVPYSASCTGNGGVPPYSFSLSSGALPAGLGLNPTTGTISGTPTKYGTFSFTVEVTDSGVPVGTATQQVAAFVVIPPPLKLSCHLATFAEFGVVYSGGCATSGGAPPFTYSISSGSLPMGIALNPSTGAISGSPATAGPSPFTVAVQDGEKTPQVASQAFPAFTVLPAILSINCNFANVPKVGAAYSTTCAVANGTPPYTISKPQGLPPGLKFNATAGGVVTISGTPTQSGQYSFTLQITDSESPSQTATQTVSGLTVTPSAFTITTTTLPNGWTGLPYSGNPLVVAGKAPYTWSLASGTLPGGLSLNAATGAITGTPAAAAAGAFSFTLQVKDSSAATTKQSFSGSISAGPVTANFTEFAALPGAGVSSLVAGPDGNLWFTTADQGSGNLIGQISTLGVVTSYSSPNALAMTAGGAGMTVGPDTPAGGSAFWFAETDSNRIGQLTIVVDKTAMTTTVSTIDFPVTTVNAKPQQIVTGPDGALWFTETGASKIGTISTAGQVTEYSTGLTAGSEPFGIVLGPDQALWFTESAAASSKIGRITAAGQVTEYSTGLTAGSAPNGIAVGPDQALWFTETAASKIGRITTAGQITEYATGLTAASGPTAIVAGPDGALWFVESAANQVGRITTDGVITEYAIPTAASGAETITVGPDGAIWFGENKGDKIARFTFTPQLTITCTAPQTSLQLGSAYAASCTAAGGSGSYTYSISSGALPPGVTLNSTNGAIGGSPTSAGTFTYTVQVSDQSSPAQTATQQIPKLTVLPAEIYTLSGFPTNTQAPGMNATNLSLELKQPSSQSITGTLALSFIVSANVADAVVLPAGYMDPALQFIDNSGNKLGTTYNFTIPANATTVPLPNIDPGTVAGGITATLTIGNAQAGSSTFLVDTLVPQIETGSVQITNITSNSFDVELSGNCTTRELNFVNFTFNVAPGAQIVGETQFSFAVNSLMSAWFDSQEGQNNGGAFSLTVPFVLSGSASAIQSVSVTLQNSLGTSAAVVGSK